MEEHPPYHEQKVRSTAYVADINRIGSKFQLYKTYIISNAYVSRHQSKYNIYNYPFQWILKYFTKVRLERNNIINPSLLTYHFASLRGLSDYVDQRILIGKHNT
ncbi:hypothetical protein ACJIZ3_003722 [Penstemon smallii]|uniref:Uncharacterized protein n=1 Tax=Penstemon smallii TaxID=265156 RepID=A0ABD3UA01_9LAMI